MNNSENEPYINTVLNPWTKVLHIKDDAMVACVLKSLNSSISITAGTFVNPVMLILWLPHARSEQVLIFIKNATDPRFALFQRILPEQNLETDFDRVRLVSGGLVVRSSTISTTTAPLSGSINASAYNEAPSYVSINASTVTSYKSTLYNVLQQVALVDGVVTLAQPFTNPFRSTDTPPPPIPTTATPSAVPTNINPMVTEETPIFFVPGTDGGWRTASLGVVSTFIFWDSITSAAPFPANWYRRMRITGQFKFEQVANVGAQTTTCTIGCIFSGDYVQGFNTVAPCVSTLFCNANISTPGPTNGRYYAMPFDFFVDIPFFATRLQLSMLDWSAGWTTTQPRDGYFTWTFYDASPGSGYGAPGSMMVLSGLNSQQTIDMNAVTNYEVVPSVSVARNVKVDMPPVDVEGMNMTKFLLSQSSRYPLILSRSSYETRQNDAFTMDRDALVGQAADAGFFSNLWNNIKKVGRTLTPMVSGAVSAFNPTLGGALGTVGSQLFARDYKNTGAEGGMVIPMGYSADGEEDVDGSAKAYAVSYLEAYRNALRAHNFKTCADMTPTLIMFSVLPEKPTYGTYNYKLPGRDPEVTLSLPYYIPDAEWTAKVDLWDAELRQVHDAQKKLPPDQRRMQYSLTLSRYQKRDPPIGRASDEEPGILIPNQASNDCQGINDVGCLCHDHVRSSIDIVESLHGSIDNFLEATRRAEIYRLADGQFLTDSENRVFRYYTFLEHRYGDPQVPVGHASDASTASMLQLMMQKMQEMENNIKNLSAENAALRDARKAPSSSSSSSSGGLKARHNKHSNLAADPHESSHNGTITSKMIQVAEGWQNAAYNARTQDKPNIAIGKFVVTGPLGSQAALAAKIVLTKTKMARHAFETGEDFIFSNNFSDAKSHTVTAASGTKIRITAGILDAPSQADTDALDHYARISGFNPGGDELFIHYQVFDNVGLPTNEYWQVAGHSWVAAACAAASLAPTGPFWTGSLSDGAGDLVLKALLANGLGSMLLVMGEGRKITWNASMFNRSKVAWEAPRLGVVDGEAVSLYPKDQIFNRTPLVIVMAAGGFFDFVGVSMLATSRTLKIVEPKPQAEAVASKAAKKAAAEIRASEAEELPMVPDVPVPRSMDKAGFEDDGTFTTWLYAALQQYTKDSYAYDKDGKPGQVMNGPSILEPIERGYEQAIASGGNLSRFPQKLAAALRWQHAQEERAKNMSTSVAQKEKKKNQPAQKGSSQTGRVKPKQPFTLAMEDGDEEELF